MNAQTLEARRDAVREALQKAHAVHLAGNPAAAGAMRKRARSDAFALVADAEAVRNEAAQMAADAVTQNCQDAATLAAQREGEAA